MPRKPPDALVYYLDANLDGPELVERLRDGGMLCEPHRDHFAPRRYATPLLALAVLLQRERDVLK